MKYFNTCVTFRGDFQLGLINAPAKTKFHKGDEVFPGREIATILSDELRNSGFEISEIQYEEPFFTFNCLVDNIPFSFMVSILDLKKNETPLWEITVTPPQLSLWQKLQKVSYEKELEVLLKSFQQIVKNEPYFNDIKWYRDFNAEGLTSKYDTKAIVTKRSKKSQRYYKWESFVDTYFKYGFPAIFESSLVLMFVNLTLGTIVFLSAFFSWFFLNGVMMLWGNLLEKTKKVNPIGLFLFSIMLFMFLYGTVIFGWGIISKTVELIK